MASDLFLQVAEASKQRDSRIQEVRSIRRYILHNKRWANDAVADVLVAIDGNGHERFQILETTAKGFQREIFKRILDGEMEASKSGEAEITPANYDAKQNGTKVINGHTCDVLELTPKKKTRYLLEGWACVDREDKAIVHVEGRTAKSISFWVGKAYLSQDFKKVGPFWYSTMSQSTADVKLLGTTQLTVEYVDYHIAPHNGPALVACREGGCSADLHPSNAKQISMLK